MKNLGNPLINKSRKITETIIIMICFLISLFI